MVGRHEALRSRLEARGDDLVLVEVAEPFELVGHDVRRCNHPDVEADRLVERLITEPFDLATDRPLRAHLLQLTEVDHLLVLILHHVGCDGWSLRIVLEQVADGYRRRLTGGASPDAADELGASDVFAWERDQLQPAAEARLADSWSATLAGAPDCTDLPSDRPRPPVRSPAGGVVRIELEPSDAHVLDTLSRHQGVTPFMTLAALVAVLLSRHTGQEDLVVGLPFANRRAPGLDSVVGYLSNMVPLRICCDATITARELLQQVRAAAIDAYDHSSLPFDAIVESVRPGRSTSWSPLFQVVVALLPGRADLGELTGLRTTVVPVHTGTSKFDLSLYLESDRGTYAGYFEYRSDIFDPATVEALWARFVRLLRDLAADVDRPLYEFDLLADDERHPAGPTPLPLPDRCAHELIREVAQRGPDATALEQRGVGLSYGELWRGVERLAGRLRAAGVGRGEVVGVCIERSFEVVTAVLASLEVGAAFVLLDPDYPTDRLATMARDISLDLVLTTAASARRAPPVDRLAYVDDLDAADALPAGGADDRCQVGPDDLAYVIFTSGSTGTPRPVALVHRGLTNVVVNSIRDLPLGPGARVLQAVSLSFDAAVWEIFMALASGATLCLTEPRLATANVALEDSIRAAGVTVAFLPPALLETVDPASVPSLQTVLTGGDRVSAALRQRWRPPRRFFAAYGPTEGTIVQTWGVCGEPTAQAPPLGRPLANVAVRVLDRHLQPVPPGGTGEAYVGGVCVGRGYLGAPGLTAERFLPDPHAEVPGARMYRTGDIVQRTTRGRVALRRQDRRPGEGPRLPDRAGRDRSRHPLAPGGGRGGGLGRPRFHAAHPRVRCGARCRRSRARGSRGAAAGHLATVHGSRSPRRDRHHPADTQRQGRPRAAPTARPRPGRAEHIRAARPRALDVRSRGRRRARRRGDRRGARAVTSVEDIYPLAPMQEGMLYHTLRHDQAGPYVEQFVFRTIGPLVIARLEHAWSEVLARHATLRSAFVWDGLEHPLQAVMSPSPVDAEVIDVDATALDVRLRRFLAEDRARGFDLTEAPLMRLTVLRSSSDTRVVWSVHHLVLDGWSMPIVLRDLATAYRGDRELRDTPTLDRSETSSTGATAATSPPPGAIGCRRSSAPRSRPPSTCLPSITPHVPARPRSNTGSGSNRAIGSAASHEPSG